MRKERHAHARLPKTIIEKRFEIMGMRWLVHPFEAIAAWPLWVRSLRLMDKYLSSGSFRRTLIQRNIESSIVSCPHQTVIV